jgi:hypothetical protein
VWDEDTPQRTDAWNRLLATAATAHSARPANLDLRSVVCPEGRWPVRHEACGKGYNRN